VIIATEADCLLCGAAGVVDCPCLETVLAELSPDPATLAELELEIATALRGLPEDTE